MSPVSSDNFFTLSRTSGDKRNEMGFVLLVSLGMGIFFHIKTHKATLKYSKEKIYGIHG